MVRKKVKSYTIEPKNSKWLEKISQKEERSRSQIVNRLIKKARESGTSW